MEMRHLRQFAAVAEELHFGRAAERLCMAQPPLSASVKQLEAELGVQLLERTSRRVTLTAAGEAFYEQAREILARTDKAADAARRAADGHTGRLAIGFAASATHDVLPDCLRAFRARFPDVELALFEMNASEQAAALTDRRIGVGFARPALTVAGVTCETLTREPFVLAVPDGHALAGQSTVELFALAGEPFIGFAPLPRPSYMDDVTAACAAVGFLPNIVQEVREMGTAVSLVAAGLGICLVPLPVRKGGRGGVHFLSLTGTSARTELTLAYRTGDPSPVLRVFRDVVRARVGSSSAG